MRVLLCIIRIEDQLEEVGQPILDTHQIGCSFFEFAGMKGHIDCLAALGEIVEQLCEGVLQSHNSVLPALANRVSSQTCPAT